MPIPVTAWSANAFPDAKSLNLALYTSDGTADNPTGLAFLAYRPLLFESYTKTTTWTSAAGGSQSTMTSAGSLATAIMVCDTAGYFGQSSDLPGLGAYEFTAAIAGSAGDGVTPGGWMLLSHFVPLNSTATQTAVGADFQHVGGSSITGSRQASVGAGGTVTPFFADLANVGANAWQPSVTIFDSGAATTTNLVNATDSSGQTPRFYAVWASVSASTSGQAIYTVPGVYEWPAPAGVTAVTPVPGGGGGGSGAGNVSAGGTEFGGGGGGGGELASDTVAVTPGNNYPVTVGAAGTAGAEPGGNGTAGGNSAFSGDSVTVTGHGGSAGSGATVAANGAGGLGGTGSGAATHHNGGAGASGSTGAYGGGGGSSAGTAVAGNAGSGASGGPAPTGGGPGGEGGESAISVVQSAAGGNAHSPTFTLSFSSAVQSGNTVICAVQWSATASITSVQLSDGTTLTQRSSVTLSSLVTSTLFIYDAYNVPGGETSIKFTAPSGSAEAFSVVAWEVSGLGSSPSIDVNTSATGGSTSTSYSVSAATSGAPELWIGAVAGHGNTSFSFGTPGGSWTTQSDYEASTSPNRSGVRAGYQTALATGTETYAGSISPSTNYGAIIVSYTSSFTLAGASPIVGPGGGAGAGLGAANGAAGLPGSVTLNWTGISGGGYGTPDLPAPYSAWSVATSIGALADADVDINSSAGITDVVNFLSNPPVVRVQTTTAQAIANATIAAITFASGTISVDSYSGYSSATGTYTVQRDGLYLCHGLVAFAANSTGARLAAFQINGTTYWGPGYKATGAGITAATKTQIFSLRAGDTVKLAAYQTSGGSLNTDTTAATRFFMAWLCSPGVPVQSWAPPDTTFRWASGTPGSALGALFQTHIGNDLGFLVNRPFLMAYQASAQAGLANGAFSTITLDTLGGIVHSDAGDNYSGWASGASNLYAAPVDGWYLLCGEFFTGSSATAGARATAAVQPNTSGGQAPSVAEDYYQVNSITSTASIGGGATILGLNYCLAGETLTPLVRADAFGGTFGTLTGTQNSGLFRPHLEVVWLSE